eukprot:4187349-Amphidinium_carterae.1
MEEGTSRMYSKVDPTTKPSEKEFQGNFSKANFTPGKTRKMKPRARQEGECPDPEFDIKFSDEAMTN